jgi:hypothetical protein
MLQTKVDDTIDQDKRVSSDIEQRYHAFSRPLSESNARLQKSNSQEDIANIGDEAERFEESLLRLGSRVEELWKTWDLAKVTERIALQDLQSLYSTDATLLSEVVKNDISKFYEELEGMTCETMDQITANEKVRLANTTRRSIVY